MSDGTQVNIYEAVIADLEKKIAAMQSVIENLRSIASPTFMGAQGSSLPQGGATAFGHDAFFGMTVADAAKKYLSAIKKTASVATISDALVAGGWKTSAKNIPENVRALLSRAPEFVRINGEFGLAEWYPGRKTRTKRTAGVDPELEELHELEDMLSSPVSSTEQKLLS